MSTPPLLPVVVREVKGERRMSLPPLPTHLADRLTRRKSSYSLLPDIPIQETDTGVKLNTFPKRNTLPAVKAGIQRRHSEKRFSDLKMAAPKFETGHCPCSIVSTPKELQKSDESGLSNITLITKPKKFKETSDLLHIQTLKRNARMLNRTMSEKTLKVQPMIEELERTPSCPPEPDIIRMCQASDRQHLKSAASTEDIGYRPKYCWCLRCQIMHSMYKTNDMKLEEWGNYPCFKR